MVHFPAPAPKKPNQVDPTDPEAQARHRARLKLGQRLSTAETERQLAQDAERLHRPEKRDADARPWGTRRDGLCSEVGCAQPIKATRLCSSHYMKAWHQRANG